MSSSSGSGSAKQEQDELVARQYMAKLVGDLGGMGGGVVRAAHRQALEERDRCRRALEEKEAFVELFRALGQGSL